MKGRDMHNEIIINGAKENNLQNINVTIPKNKFVVLTGLSGSGKSSLAYDTLGKECQRQYMESLGLATDFIQRPKVDSIIGLAPAISIDQHLTNNSPRSTVGTATEIFTYLRLLYSKLGLRECPGCGKMVHPDFEILEDASEEINNEEAGDGGFLCPHCKSQVPELSMSHFSFNKPQGACETCMGLGTVYEPLWDSLIDDSKSIIGGAIREWDIHYIKRNTETFSACGKYYGFSLDMSKPVRLLSQMEKDLIFYGVNHNEFKKYFPDKVPPETASNGRFEGIGTNLLRRFSEHSENSGYQKKLEKFLNKAICPDCKGGRLKEYSRRVTVGGTGIIELSEIPLTKLNKWALNIKSELTEQVKKIALPIINDIEIKTDRLIQAGIGYLTLNRGMTTLSGGEAQRLRLSSLLSSGLTGVLYVLDEPTTGLHPKDTDKLFKMLEKLKDMGNTVLVIEHDPDIMLKADYIIDMGPGAGKNGGRVIAQGTPEEIRSNPSSITGKYLKPVINAKQKNRITKGYIEIHGATDNNLKNIDVEIPLGKLVAVTGVSGSGKSTLIFDILAKVLNEKSTFHRLRSNTSISGLENIDRAVIVDQAPIGRNSGSNAATYTDVFTPIRNLFSELPQAKACGFTAREFSFNVPGGRCERCEGSGLLSVEMHFLSDVEIVCPSCCGKRFNKEVLNIKYKGKSISDILNMSVEDSYELFREIRDISVKLKILVDVGLGYLKLGQSATTLSGGEAQRVKLAKELARNGKGHSLYLLDEPTTGLHPEDVLKLSLLLHKLIDSGNSVVAIEHNLDLIREADWIIDLGPEGGEAGGYIMAQGTPNEVAEIEASHTGQILKKCFSGDYAG